MYVLFWDMHSGGGQKLDWAKIYVEADSEEEAIEIFQQEFGRDPNHITCNCCGEDYSISSAETLEEASGYHRGLDYAYDRANNKGRYLEDGDSAPEGWEISKGYSERMTLEEYVKRDFVKIVPKDCKIFKEKFNLLETNDSA